MKNLKLIACLLSIVLFPLLVTGCESRNDSFQYLTVEDFQKVTIGMTPDQVKEILGGRSPEAAATMEGVPVGWGWVIWNEEDHSPGVGGNKHFKALFKDGKVSEVEFSSGDVIDFTFEPRDGS